MYDTEKQKKKRSSINTSTRMREFLASIDNINVQTSFNEGASTSINNVSFQSLDQDLQMSANINVPELDPLTKTALENPVKNIICGHIYGKISVERSLSINNRLR